MKTVAELKEAIEESNRKLGYVPSELIDGLVYLAQRQDLFIRDCRAVVKNPAAKVNGIETIAELLEPFEVSTIIKEQYDLAMQSLTDKLGSEIWGEQQL